MASVFSLFVITSIIAIYGQPCDYIWPTSNSSNCGICLHNNSCSWCTYDNTCHVTSTYDKTCGDSNHKGEIYSGSNHLFKCCESAHSCSQCTTLWYVECDWCISSKKCINNTKTSCNAKEVVYKGGVCHGDKPDTIWDKIKHYYFEIPILYRIILITLASLCLILCCICMSLFCGNWKKKRRLKKKRKQFKQGNIQDIRKNVKIDYLAYTSHNQ